MLMLLADAAPVVQQVHVYGYGVGWGTLSLINAGLAQAKRRSGLAWWIASLILGPIATFLVVVLPAIEPVAYGPTQPYTQSAHER